jgi:hypothetical protein
VYAVCYIGLYQLYSECNILWEMPSQRNRILERDSGSMRQRLSIVSPLNSAHILHRITGGGRVLRPQTTPWRISTLPPAGSKCRIVTTGFRRRTNAVWCVFRKRQTRKREKNVQSAKWCFVLTRITFKCQNCKMGLCFDPYLRVFHAKSQFWDQHLTGKSKLLNRKYHFSTCKDFLWIPVYCFI